MSISEKAIEYWQNRTPWSWGGYKEMRDGRYELHDYLYNAFELDKFAGKKVLSIGCGAGIDEIEMAKNGAEVWATDPSDQAIWLTNKNAKEAGVDMHIEKADSTNLQYENEKFDHVYAFGVLHHIPKVNRAMNELWRVLKDNGKISAMLYHKDSLLYYYSILYLRGVKGGYFAKGYDEQDVLSEFSEGKQGCPFTKVYTIREAQDLLLQNGFFPHSIEPFYRVVDEIDTRKVKIDCPNSIGWHLVVKGIKTPKMVEKETY